MAIRLVSLILLVLVASESGFQKAWAQDTSALTESLTFFVGFDETLDASVGHGDRRMHTASTIQRTDGKPGVLRNDIELLANQGRHGGAVRFNKTSSQVVYYQAEKNLDWRPDDWSGTLSLWMRLSPEKDLHPDYADPIQITDKKWDDASFFLDFSKDERPRHFRLGVFSDFKVWNPENVPWEKLAVSKRPMIVVEKPPFTRERWTHIVATWSHYNTGLDGAEARMYVDGKLHGRLRGRQTIGWDLPKTAIMLGLSYTGDLDELSLFNRALTEDEVLTLHRLEHGVADITSRSRQ